MRRSFRQLAAVKPSRFLEAGSPTGLAGLLTHPSPRKTLMYLYSSTLDELKKIPESSLYRQSTEALARHRLDILTAVEPEGYAEWAVKAEKIIAEHPEVFTTPEGGIPYNKGQYKKEIKDGKTFVTIIDQGEWDDQNDEWDGDEDITATLEGTRTTAERANQVEMFKDLPPQYYKTVNYEPEPPLTAEQIEEIENKIGAGLIEEVIQVAEGELKLVDTMIKAKVWEDLEEKPVEGQWTYFKRDSGTAETQKPPQ